MDVKTQIIYVHPAIRTYRVEAFKLLANNLNVEFFWSEDMSKDSNHILEEVNRILEDTDIKFIQANEFHNLPIDNFSWQLLKLPFMKYKVYIFSSITSVPYLLLAPILRFIGKRIILFDELWRYPIEVSKYKKVYPYVKFLSRYCLDSVVTAGSKAEEFYVNELGFDKDKIFIAYNTTVDTQKYVKNSSIDVRVKYKLKMVTNKKKLLYLGRIVRYKGLDILIQAMKNISDEYNLIVIGSGEFLEECINLTNELNLEDRVHFLGSCLSSESVYFYKNCDIFVLPSRIILNQNTQLESWGFTINEAMALEIPVVTTTAVGSAYDLIIDGITGTMAQESDVNSLSDRVNFIIHNNEDNIIGKSAREHVLKICSYKENLMAYKNAVFKALNE